MLLYKSAYWTIYDGSLEYFEIFYMSQAYKNRKLKFVSNDLKKKKHGMCKTMTQMRSYVSIDANDKIL